MAKVQDNNNLDLLVEDTFANFSILHNPELSSIDSGMDTSSPSIPMLEGIDFYASPNVFNMENRGLLSSPSEPWNGSNSLSNEEEEKFKAKVKCSQDLMFNSNVQTDLYNRTSKPCSQNQKFENGFKTKNNVKMNNEVKSNSKFSGNSDIKSLEFEPLVLTHSFDSKASTKIPQFCPQCKSKFSEDRALRYFHVSLEKSILLCSTENCTYPFDTHNEILNVKDESPEDVLQSEIDFDIENISINTNNFESKLVQLNSLVQPFLNSLDHLKRRFEKLQSGNFTLEGCQEVENNYEFVNIMNQAIESPPEQNLNESLTIQATNAVNENTDFDGLMEENMDVQQMLERFG